MNSICRRLALVLLALLVLVAAAAGAPYALQRSDAFRVRTLELHGATWLDAATALEVSGITRESSVFEPFEPWRERLRRHPLVADIEIARRLPSTLVLHVREATPRAFVRTPELRVIDGRGRVLPVHPAGLDLDLPIIGTVADIAADGSLADTTLRALARMTTDLALVVPGLLDWFSELHPIQDGVRVVLRDPLGAELLLPRQIDVDQLHELRLTLADLAATRGAGRDLDLVARIDLRYREQVVVALHKRKR